MSAPPRGVILFGSALLLAAAATAAVTATGRAQAPADDSAASLHPTFPLLDANGRHVLESGTPVSPVRSCGACHDAGFIEGHSFHADAGFRDLVTAGEAPSGRAWDLGAGWFGRWSPFTYRTLSALGDDTVDQSTADWLRFQGQRHPGGGPAVYTRDGRPLREVDPAQLDPVEGTALDPETGERVAWDWRASGVAEMNCFLCHLPDADDDARREEMEAGRFGWAATATLERVGVVQREGEGWVWQEDAFDEEGHVRPELLRPQEPTSANCGVCHGVVHGHPDVPVLLEGCEPDAWRTLTTGEIFSAQRIRDSGLNLIGKEELARTWDVHAERQLECADCHHSLNNPVYRAVSDESRPAHLRFDARRLDLQEYLKRPSHDFAHGAGERTPGAPPMRGCATCHDAEATHDWLPYAPRHFSVLSCNACHSPRLYAPARRVVDWTVMTVDGKPGTECRGVESDVILASTPVSGYAPVLLPRVEADGQERLAPHNLLSAWYWVGGEPARPVPVGALAAAYLRDGSHHPDVIRLLDRDDDGELSRAELRLDTEAQVEAIRVRLRAAGVEDPRIAAEIEVYPVRHAVVSRDGATRDCQACHAPESRLGAAFLLAERVPGDVIPAPVGDAGVTFPGEIRRDAQGRLLYEPANRPAGIHVLGHDAVRAANVVGLLGVIGVFLAAGLHALLRFAASRGGAAAAHVPASTPAVYMYTRYERAWHWLQAITVLLLLATGLEIHFPASLRLFGFELAVRVHNVIGFVVVANAFLAAFYHLASGRIRQYVPEPKGFFDAAIVQARYYGSGIFRKEPHPFEKSPDRKLNPLQQITYLMILNVLLPLQTLTGILMWSAQKWPGVDEWFGGLVLLAPVHALGAWLFAAFLLAHVYLTTTGPTPTSHIRAMILGWEGGDESPRIQEESR